MDTSFAFVFMSLMFFSSLDRTDKLRSWEAVQNVEADILQEKDEEFLVFISESSLYSVLVWAT